MYKKGVQQHQGHHGFKYDKSANDDRSGRKKSSRSKMSCKQCRDRKVKCDRIYPCSPCVSRGRSADCLFENSGTAVDQAQAIKNHRKQEERLLRKIHELEQFIRDHHADAGIFPLNSLHTDSTPRSSKGTRGRKTRNHTDSSSLFFGDLSLARLVEEYDKLDTQPFPSSLTHTTPRTLDIFAYQNSAGHPFPCLWPTDSGINALINCLPPREEIFRLFTLFEQRSQTGSFANAPDGISKDEISRFLSRITTNAEKHPSMLALVLVILAHGDLFAYRQAATEGAHSRHKPGQNSEPRGDVFVAAAMQALRLGSSMSRPSLSSVQALLLLGPYLVNTGRLLDASSLFGLTVRMAQSIGLHREPTRLKPIPLTRECLTRRSIWWHILYLDQYYSSMLGQPLSVSCFGDCLPPVSLKVDDTEHRLQSFICQFTVTTTEILRCEDLTSTRIQAYSERLLRHLNTLPASLQFSETWLESGTQVPNWPLDVQAANFYIRTHVYLILMNRQKKAVSGVESPNNIYEATGLHVGPTPRYNHSFDNSMASNPKSKKTELFFDHSSHGDVYDRILDSSRAILHAFEFLCSRDFSNLLDWTICQAAFHAAYMLGLAMYEKNDFKTDVQKILATRENFVSLANSVSALRENTPLRGILNLSTMASERLAMFLRGTWNDLRIQEDMQDDCDKVVDQKGMVLLEDPGLIHASSKSDDFRIVNWQISDSQAWEDDSPQGLAIQRPSLPIPKEKASPSTPEREQGDAAVFFTSPIRQSLRSSLHFVESDLNGPHIDDSHGTMPASNSAKLARTSPLSRHHLVASPADDIDALLSTAPFPQPLQLPHPVPEPACTSSYPTLPVDAPILSSCSDQNHDVDQLSPPCAKSHSSQGLARPPEPYTYTTYPQSWDAFPPQIQQAQSTISSVGQGQGVLTGQGQFNTSSSIIGTPRTPYFTPESKTAYQQQELQATCAIQYSQPELSAGAASNVYFQGTHTGVAQSGFDWAQPGSQ